MYTHCAICRQSTHVQYMYMYVSDAMPGMGIPLVYRRPAHLSKKYFSSINISCTQYCFS